MNALLYLRRKKLKNQLRGLIQKPSRLIYMVLIIAALALTVVGGHVADGRTEFREILELNAGAAALYLMMFVITVNSGFSRGGNLFNLSDVNLLFPSPIRPQTILFHGLLQQLTTSLFVGFFLLFQYTNLHMAYGISYGQMLLLLLGYAISVFLGQVTAMLVYSFTNGDEIRKRIGKGILYAVAGAFLAYVAFCALRSGTDGALTRAVAAVNGPVFYCLPVVGWLALAIGGFLTGMALHAVCGVLLCAVFLCLLIVLIFHSDPDYYEDVLKSAEISKMRSRPGKRAAWSNRCRRMSKLATPVWTMDGAPMSFTTSTV